MLIPCAMDGNDPATATFPADAQAVSRALSAARAFAGAAALAPDPAAHLAIVVEELVANIVEHGGAGGTSIMLALGLEARGVRLLLRDAGTYFDPRLVERPEEVPERGGGAGLALVMAWARIVDYARSDGINRLELILPLPNIVPT